MDLSEVRALVQQSSGRYDLTDAILDSMIQQGQVELETLVDFTQGLRVEHISLAAADYQKEVIGVVSIEHIYLKDSDEAYIVRDNLSRDASLKRRSYNDFIIDHPDMEAEDEGTPTEWTLDLNTSSAGFYIRIWPPADAVYALEIHGVLKLKTLSIDADTNAWTVLYPNVLVLAACRQIALVLEGNIRKSSELYSGMLSLLYGVDRNIASFEDVGDGVLPG